MSFDLRRAFTRELNVGLQDQKIRYGVGVALVLASVFLANIPMLLLGGILIGTARLRWCPAYSGFRKSTVVQGEEASPPEPGAESH